MLQLGVGTGKELPTLLGGFGLRLTKPKKVSIAFGWVLAWKKDLNNLKVGDEIKSTEELDKDLKYSLFGKKSTYIGIQFNF